MVTATATTTDKPLSKGAQAGIVVAVVLLGPPLVMGILIAFFWIVHKIRGR